MSAVLLEKARALVAKLQTMPGVPEFHYADLKAYLADEEILATEAQIKEAREKYASDDVEVDETAFASHGDDGVWVQAWVWLARPDTEG
jgi:hypothetical protein